VFDLPVPFRRCDVPRFPLEPLFSSRDSFINNAKKPCSAGSHAFYLYL
jgi:hypothetical protein